MMRVKPTSLKVVVFPNKAVRTSSHGSRDAQEYVSELTTCLRFFNLMGVFETAFLANSSSVVRLTWTGSSSARDRPMTLPHLPWKITSIESGSMRINDVRLCLMARTRAPPCSMVHLRNVVVDKVELDKGGASVLGSSKERILGR